MTPAPPPPAEGPTDPDLLDVDDLVQIAQGVVPGVLVRDAGLLASAAARPRTTVLGQDAYPTFAHKAAALLHSLVRNHCLIDGNKRLAWSATRVLCLLNGVDIAYDVDEAEQLVLAAARGELDVDALAASIAEHLVPAG
ncbi:type II toxin-antitoxin system death-on-curing family toxin [Kineococcus glutinatus]|uniref:Type II toxin-antitoxin system death-on-curing family toxin n=1 Tax=Kineococcus glutinatus TaxID=1070872 RepID=A0ABP8VE52_9ACTN